MAQVQLNSPPPSPPQHEATSCSETSQLDESRPLDPPDLSFSLRSDEQPPVSVETRTPGPCLSTTLCDEQPSLSPTGCLYDNIYAFPYQYEKLVIGVTWTGFS